MPSCNSLELTPRTGNGRGPGLVVPASQVATLIQRTTCMVGNVSEMISQSRRTRILQIIETSWSKYGEEDFPGAVDALFGEDFRTSLTEKVDKETTLAKAASITKRNKDLKGKTRLPVTRRKAMVIAHFSRGPCLQIQEQAGQEFFPVQLRVKGKGNLLSEQSNIRESEADTPPVPRTSPTTPPKPTSTSPQHKK